MISPWVPAVLYTLIKIPLSGKKIFLPGVSASTPFLPHMKLPVPAKSFLTGGGGIHLPTIKASNQIPLVVINALGSCSNSYVMPTQSLGASRRSPLNGWWRRGMRAIRLCFGHAPCSPPPARFWHRNPHVSIHYTTASVRARLCVVLGSLGSPLRTRYGPRKRGTEQLVLEGSTCLECLRLVHRRPRGLGIAPAVVHHLLHPFPHFQLPRVPPRQDLHGNLIRRWTRLLCFSVHTPSRCPSPASAFCFLVTAPLSSCGLISCPQKVLGTVQLEPFVADFSEAGGELDLDLPVGPGSLVHPHKNSPF